MARKEIESMRETERKRIALKRKIDPKAKTLKNKQEKDRKAVALKWDKEKDSKAKALKLEQDMDRKAIALRMFDKNFVNYPQSKKTVVINTKNFENSFFPGLHFESHLLKENIRASDQFVVVIKTDEINAADQSNDTILAGKTLLRINSIPYEISSYKSDDIFYKFDCQTLEKVEATYSGNNQKLDVIHVMTNSVNVDTTEAPNSTRQEAEILFYTSEIDMKSLEVTGDKTFSIKNKVWFVDNWFENNEVVVCEVHRTMKQKIGGH